MSLALDDPAQTLPPPASPGEAARTPDMIEDDAPPTTPPAAPPPHPSDPSDPAGPAPADQTAPWEESLNGPDDGLDLPPAQELDHGSSDVGESVRQQVREAISDGRDALGKVIEEGEGRAGIHAYVTRLPDYPDRPQMLEWCREVDTFLAAVLLAIGVVYSIFGYSLFKLLVMANVAGLGAWSGWWVGKQMGAPIPGAAVGAVIGAAIAWPAMRFTIATCGGIVGMILGLAVWRLVGLEDAYAPAGGLIGGVFCFMLSFVLFKLSIIAFTAVQGAIMVLGGLLGLFLKYPEFDDLATDVIVDIPVVLPIVLFALSVISALFQQHYHREQPADGRIVGKVIRQ